MWFILLFVSVVVLGAVVLEWLPEWLRGRVFRRRARELGMQYLRRDTSIAKQYRFLDALRKGFNRYALNILRGAYQGYSVQVFDYHYQTLTGHAQPWRSTTHHYFSFFLLEQERSFPELRIYPMGLLLRLGKMIGFEDIEFESLEFSRAFAVKSRDRKFAYDICHPRMMEYLLEHRDLSLEIEGWCIAMSFSRRLEPEEIPERLEQLVEVRRLFPEYLYRD